MNREQIEAAQRIGLAVMEAIAECGELGAPEGPIYAALMSQGCTLSQFQSLVGGMERNGVVTRSESHLLELTDKGRGFMSLLQSKFGKLQHQAA